MADAMSVEVGKVGLPMEATAGEGGAVVKNIEKAPAVEATKKGSREDARQKDAPDDRGVPGDKAEETTPEGGAAPEEDAPGTDDGLDALQSPESFDPEDADNMAAWDAEYLADGDLNLERFQKEVSKNMQGEDGKPVLNENTYAYLKAKGIGQKVVDAYIADRLKALKYDEVAASTEKQDHDLKLFTHVHEMALSETMDGPEVFRSALDWARDGGYTDAQKARFEDVMMGGKASYEDKQDAVELLVNKFARSAAFKEIEARKRKADLKRAPGRDATRGQGTPAGSGTERFANRDEWRAARKAAKGDLGKLRQIDKIAKASGLVQE